MANTDYSILQEENEEEYQRMKAELDAKKPKRAAADYIKEFLITVNKPVPQSWLKQVDVGGGRKISYIPIYKIEFCLTRVFGALWKREILSEQVMFNSVSVRVRLHYCIPGTDIWLFQDGAGSAPAKVNQGKMASDLSEIKANSVQQCYPSAASFATSNAAERIGRLFGAGLNKDDALFYQGHYDPDANNNQQPANNLPSYTAPTLPKAPTTGDKLYQPEPTTSGVHVEMPNSNGNGNGAQAAKPTQAEMKFEQPQASSEFNLQF